MPFMTNVKLHSRLYGNVTVPAGRTVGQALLWEDRPLTGPLEVDLAPAPAAH